MHVDGDCSWRRHSTKCGNCVTFSSPCSTVVVQALADWKSYLGKWSARRQASSQCLRCRHVTLGEKEGIPGTCQMHPILQKRERGNGSKRIIFAGFCCWYFLVLVSSSSSSSWRTLDEHSRVHDPTLVFMLILPSCVLNRCRDRSHVWHGLSRARFRSAGGFRRAAATVRCWSWLDGQRANITCNVQRNALRLPLNDGLKKVKCGTRSVTNPL